MQKKKRKLLLIFSGLETTSDEYTYPVLAEEMKSFLWKYFVIAYNDKKTLSSNFIHAGSPPFLYTSAASHVVYHQHNMWDEMKESCGL